MRKSWELAKEEAAKTGKKAKECFGDACRAAWALARSEANNPQGHLVHKTVEVCGLVLLKDVV